MSERYSMARFWKCALQVNPFGYCTKFRGQDHGMSEQEYNAELLRICKDKEIKVIGLADHGNVDCVDSIRDLFLRNGILVFPGFEIASSEKAHFVCLFPESTSKDELNRYLGHLNLLVPNDGVRPSTLGGEILLQKVDELGGFCYAAHATGDSGVLSRKLNHVWKDPLLKAAQISGTIDELRNDEGNAYRQILLNSTPEYKREHPIALINAKDVAEPNDLGNPTASCLVKMTRPCFESFKAAFFDPESRVRLNSDVSEDYYSKITVLRFTGGYLDGIEIEFSHHLNTVIGGRGTGKSTLIECIRYALDKPPLGKSAKKQHDEIIRENLGREKGRVELKVYSQSKRKAYSVSRRYGEPPIVRDSEGKVSNFTPADILPSIEIYGQNEIYEIAQSGENQLRLIDRFFPKDALDIQDQLTEVERKLRDNKGRLIKAINELDDLQGKIGQLPKMEEDAQQYRTLGLEEKLRIVPFLEREKQIVERANAELNQVENAIQSLKESLPDTTFINAAAVSSLPHQDLLLTIKTILDKASEKCLIMLDALEKDLPQYRGSLNQGIESLLNAVKLEEDSIQSAFKDLPSLEGHSGKEIGFAYQDLLRRIESIKPMESKQENQKKLVQQIEQERKNLLADLSDVRGQRTEKLQKAIRKLNNRLERKLRLRVTPEGKKTALKQFLNERNLEGVGEKRLTWIDDAKELTPLSLVYKIREGKEALLKSDWGITPLVADALSKLQYSDILDLETLDLPDDISIELNVSHATVQFKVLEKLSTGQQCTAILHLLLLENADPLIMDQPEDNLDNAFIAERIVTELRASKTQRQFLFATHNANIPVFGDAEWIGVISASQDGASLPYDAQGAVDVPEIRDQAANILEGGKEAFKQRMQKYGIK
jgi:ABC-type lipoprotein export system ATPase subunit